MRLSDLILDNMEAILQAWKVFARSVDTQLPNLDNTGLRNHAEQILRAVVLDMHTFQSDQQQIDDPMATDLSAKTKRRLPLGIRHGRLERMVS